MSEQLARHICKTLERNYQTALFVGGCVRDRLMGRTPKDFDVVTDATPSRLKELFPNADLVGASFGVIVVKDPDGGRPVEVATFRKDGQYKDGRRPETVEFTTQPQEDAMRRDFTINALMEDPETGQIFDYVGGKDDLKNQVIRTVGAPGDRFHEDYLRMLRAVRFAARFRFSIDDETMSAIRTCFDAIRDLAKERIAQEINGILTQGNADYAFRLMLSSRLLEEIFLFMYDMIGCEQPKLYHPEGDVWTHTLLMLGDRLGFPDDRTALVVRLAALFHDSGKPLTREIMTGCRIGFPGHEHVSARIAEDWMEEYRYSNDLIDQVQFLVANHMRLGYLADMRLSNQLRLIRKPGFKNLCMLHWLDCMSSNQDLTSWRFAWNALCTTPEATLRPDRLITGNDLIALGLQPGPEIGRLLKLVEEHQLDGQITTKEQALEFIQAEREKTHAAEEPQEV